MADVNANIGVNIDTSLALAQLKSLQRQISQFHTSIARSSESAALAQKSLQKNFLNSVNSIGAFSAELRTVKSTTESFTSSLEGNKFSMREYFRYAGGATKTFGRLFKSEFDTIGKVAEERVKRLQTQYIKMGRDASGAMQAIAITPTSLDMENYGTKTAIAAQKQALFNQLMKQGSTNLLNFGKNTQWAGRQLMVGFTIPLAMVGSAATKTFMEMEAQTIKFKKVYGDLFTPEAETQEALDNIKELGRQFTQYGVAVSTTVGLAAEAAAAGFSGLDLQRQTSEATRLSILGQIDTQKALETTISLQNAFGMSSDKLADSINFLNAVENQTVVSLDDITTAIPKVAPVIQQLGGDVKDLTFFMAAMKEGGINASEGANALKSGLAALINPTGRANEMLKGFGINASEIVTKNKGNLKATVVEFATALNQLDPLNRAQAIEQMFGKFQFARLSTLFANVAKDGNQAARVLDLANSSVEELSSLSEKELGLTAESSMNKFKKAVEDLKFSLIPVGKAFLEAVTPIVEFVGGILEKFGNLSDGTKKAITIITVLIGGIGPIALMAFGLLANGIANILKLFGTLRNGYLRLTGQSQVLGNQTQYLTMEQIEAASASHSLNQAHARLTQQFTAESAAVNQLILAYQGATRAGAAFAMANPGSMLPRRKGYANGVVSVPGSGKGDTVPAMLTPGEAVIPAEMAKKYAPLINGMIAGNIPGYRLGRVGREASGGELAQRNVSGGYDLSHIGGIITKTGQELLKLAETQTQNTRRLIEKLVENSKDGINTIFDVLDNRITVQSKELNQAVGETGSGRKAPIELFKRDAIERSGAFNAPLLVQMEEAGASQEELQSAVSEITGAITLGLEDLSGQTTITAEEIDNLVQKAYKVVGETNAKVKDAYTKMQEPGALKEVAGTGVFGRQGLRGGYNTPTQKKKVSAMVQKMSPETYPTQQAFVFTGEAARKVGIQNAEEIAKIFDQLSKEAKRRVQTLLGDINAMSAQVVAEAKSAGIDMGKSAITGVALGAKTASPSKDTIKTGEDIGKGLEIGLESRKDEVAATGTSLGKVATQSVSRGAKTTGPITPGEQYNIQKTQGGVPISQVTRNAPVPPQVVQQASLQARMMQMSSDRLQKFDRNIMGASFAISSLSGIASMSGGKFGNMAGTISKVTGAMFALQAITGLLTQTKALELAQSRLGMARGALISAKESASVAGAAGKSGLLGTLGRVTLGLRVFLGPIGGATIAAAGMYAAFKFIRSEQEKTRLSIEGLGDAANLSKTQLEKLGDIYGFTPKETKFALTPTVAGVVGEKRQKVEETKTLYADNKEFQNNIKTLRTATKQQADIIFRSMAIQLAGQGATQEAIEGIIIALQESAGRTDLKFDFKSFDLNTEKGQKAVQQSVKSVIGSYSKNFKTEYDKASQAAQALADKGLAEITDDKLKKSLVFASGVISSNISSMKLQLESGTISADTFSKTFDNISASIKNMPQASALYLIEQTLKNLAPEAAKSVTSLKNVADQMLVIKAISLGLDISQAQIDQLNYQGGMSQNADKMRKQIEKDILSRAKVTAEAAKILQDAFRDTGDVSGEKSPFQQAVEQLQNQTKEITNTVTSYNKLTKAGVKAGKAFAIAKDPILAAAIATTKVGTDAWKKLLKLIKQTDTELIKSKLLELKADNEYTEQFTKIVPVLKKLGLNAEEIDNIFSDPSFAQQFIKGIKNGKMKTKDLKTLIDETVKNRKVKIEFDTSKLTEDEKFDKAMAEANDMFDKVQAGIEASYRGAISAQEKIISDAENEIRPFQKNIDDIQTKIDDKRRDLEMDITRKIEGFQQGIEKLQNDIKTKFEDPLSKLSDEGDILSNNLSLIDRQTSKINEKYDAQAAALTKISEINSEISGQQKQQLGLADALSRGDISAAAAAVQEMRATSAAAAQGRQSGVLEAARTEELSRVTSGGMTRLQIEERQFKISQESFALQQGRKLLEEDIAKIEKNQIAPLNVARLAAETAIRIEEDNIYNIQKNSIAPQQKIIKNAEDTLYNTQQKLKADLDIIEQNKQALADAKILRDLDFIDQQESAKKYKGILTESETTAKNIIAKLAEKVITIHNIHTTYTSSGSGAGAGSGSRAANDYLNLGPLGGLGAGVVAGVKTVKKMYGGKIMPMSYGGMVPKYMAVGGRVGSDTVPAMLTPGEFVMNKAASKRFGPMLEAMNNSKYPSMIKDLTPTTYSNVSSSISMPISSNLSSTVNDNSSTMYNYNVGINVNESNASSGDIARAVIGQIKYIDSQRLRGQR